jgi:hypothetical protein
LAAPGAGRRARRRTHGRTRLQQRRRHRSHAYSIGQICTGTGSKKWYTEIMAYDGSGNKVMDKTSNRPTISC